ncbi:recombinase family protein [Streptomyces sp. NPDC057193]|uniref:recombinase family protein n=1 Tax=Streptomyces sp. NPDC057193 TaxID=3346043 RepID=UPI003644B326
MVHVVADGDEKGGKTGKSTIDEREGLMEAMKWIADGRADGILAPNLDCLARELTVQEAVLAYTWALGGRVFTADHGEHLQDDEDDPMRTAMRQMRGVFHQLDRGLIRKATARRPHDQGRAGRLRLRRTPLRAAGRRRRARRPRRREGDREPHPGVARRGGPGCPCHLPGA